MIPLGPKSLFGNVRPARNCTSNPTNSLLLRATAWCAAIALVGCAASQNVSYSFAVGSAKSELAGYILAGGALAASVMSAVCIAVALTGRGAAVRLAALFLGCWCLAYGVSCSLGFIAGSKDAAAASRSVIVGEAADRRAMFNAALAELGTLKGQHPTTIKRRRELQQVMRENATVPAPGARAAVTAIDPQAVVLSHYLSAMGWSASPESVSMATTAFATAFYEVAAALSLAVARGTGNVPARPQAPVSPAPPLPTPAPVEPAQRSPEPRREASQDDKDDDRSDPPSPPPSRKPRGRAGRPATVIPAEALNRIRAKGGVLAGSLTDVGRAIGAKSKTTAHRALHAMADAGLIVLQTTPAGCRVALAV
jgi:hypothetical protein